MAIAAWPTVLKYNWPINDVESNPTKYRPIRPRIFAMYHPSKDAIAAHGRNIIHRRIIVPLFLLVVSIAF